MRTTILKPQLKQTLMPIHLAEMTWIQTMMEEHVKTSLMQRIHQEVVLTRQVAVVPVREKQSAIQAAALGWLDKDVDVGSMGFRYQKRVNLGKGAELNLSKSGVSYSKRTRYGSIGSRGFSIRTGIPGLTFKSNWGKSKEGFLILVVFGIAYLSILVIYNIFFFLIDLVKFII